MLDGPSRGASHLGWPLHALQLGGCGTSGRSGRERVRFQRQLLGELRKPRWRVAAGARFDVSSELRATKDRLAEITKYVEELDAGLGQLRASCDEANATEARLALEVDSATNNAVHPFLSQRDDLMRSQQTAAADLERAGTAIKMFDGLERRAVTVARLEASLGPCAPNWKHQRHNLTATPSSTASATGMPRSLPDGAPEVRPSIRRHQPYPPHARDCLHLRLVRRPYADRAGLDPGNLRDRMGNRQRPPRFPHDRQPAKELGQGGHRDAEFANSVAVVDFYKHLHDWLKGSGHGAQILVVDNAPATVGGR